MYCIETQELGYRYAQREAVLQDVGLQVPMGAIYGFLGPNGAGKTTTLRLILGMLQLQRGRIQVFGQSPDRQRTAILARTGALIESPSVYAHLTAAENLAVLQKIHRCPAKRAGEVLALTGLGHAAGKKAGKLSLGMKQRLGIAMALLHQPNLLILDEPTNGLDPEGIIEIRELLLHLNRQLGTTILISSHLLSEIEKLATHAGIIHKGRLLFQGTLQALQQQQAHATATTFLTDDPGRTADLMRQKGLSPVRNGDGIAIPDTSPSVLAGLNLQLVSSGILVHQIHTAGNDLESIFIDLIKN